MDWFLYDNGLCHEIFSSFPFITSIIFLALLQMLCIFRVISTCNHKFVGGIWDKLPGYIFENFEISRVKRG